MRGGKRDNRKKREDDKRGGFRGGAPLKRHYTLSEDAARVVRDSAKRDGIERENWLNLLILRANNHFSGHSAAAADSNSPDAQHQEAEQ